MTFNENDSREASMDQRRNSTNFIPLDENNADYEELNTVSPLPLHLLFGADHCVTGNQRADNINTKEVFIIGFGYLPQPAPIFFIF